ncbi:MULTISPECIES: enoyl-CoA hydratase-related protein [Variovorax]|uniref:enoyl-CoA hydratase-related protein n=1 Tax=Variovorax TaxID=34072 RepID=UPI00086A1A76|nr:MULTISPECIES: enoyl-CoA hydratase-related protein [Variovorax]MBN8755380.1 enoyl-CoA hydratase/isomerase family protein [Variovorax sp.]ODU14154.1 MAG: enoyl-CoA hydratase [Variovorax sp. SCN 67-85]ODV22856.1 MAG: enoyl-CoA hydratase [Variovorax sp. SCN 67-20]OJZ12633.1 MAG: enoyl-CoA hydratase [Variovorax sp. 67-131]UKI09234.1 enoyl-CoA hydratase-related protein [Variovorax paradoxus]
MSDQSFILYELNDGIATLTLNLPAKLNPIARELQVELRDALERIRDDRAVRAVILTGAGKAFCVGADLSAMAPGETGKSLGTQTAEWMQSLSNPLIETLRTLPVPVVAAVNGPAAGAGVGLAMAADVTIAARSAYFYLPFLPKLGIVPDLGCTWAIPRRAGRARAMGMALLDERVDAERAVQWGLIWSCVDDAKLQEEATGIAQRVARLPAHAVVEAREAFEASERHSLGEQLHYESERQRELIDRPSFREGVSAFLQKRAPVFGSR